MELEGTAGDYFKLEYWTPDPALSGYVSGYHRYQLSPEPGTRHADVFFPGWANLRFTMATEPWSVQNGARIFDPVPAAALFGPSSRAGFVDAGSGTLAGIGVTPTGWARLFARSAEEFANRIVPMQQLIGEEADLFATALEQGASPRQLFDRWLLERLERSAPEPASVGRILAAINDPEVSSVAKLIEETGIPERALIRITRFHFGFPPKQLLRRARFLRALLAVAAARRGCWSGEIRKAGYYDQAHFVHDCHWFLGMSLREFLRLPKPIAEASLRLRDQVLGASVQALHEQRRP